MSESLQPFADMMKREEAGIDLMRACLMIAQDAYPDLDIDAYVAAMDHLAVRLRARLQSGVLEPASGARDTEARVIALNEFLFEELQYKGNTDDYYDPRNSYLNEVIDRRTGIPITLSILYMELGKRIGLPFDGVSFPGHFLVRLPIGEASLILDPFMGGAPQSEAELRERLQRVIPEGAAAGVPVAELPLDQFLESASKRQILARVLRNLKAIYRATDRPDRMLAVLNRMLVLYPDAANELRDRGYVFERLECWRPALQDLTDYLQREPDAADLADVRASIVELSVRCARLN
jgi:regulator of sirC expression with transglutaminase-like and TPR domain